MVDRKNSKRCGVSARGFAERSRPSDVQRALDHGQVRPRVAVEAELVALDGAVAVGPLAREGLAALLDDHAEPQMPEEDEHVVARRPSFERERREALRRVRVGEVRDEGVPEVGVALGLDAERRLPRPRRGARAPPGSTAAGAARRRARRAPPARPRRRPAPGQRSRAGAGPRRARRRRGGRRARPSRASSRRARLPRVPRRSGSPAGASGRTASNAVPAPSWGRR